LRALTKLDYRDYEVVVVDNASVGTETAEVVAATPFRYVREDRPGLNWARNRGIAESQSEIIAYVDDDAVVDPNWLAAIVAAFEDPVVDAVTGLVLAAELIWPAQHVFEQYGGMGKGMNRRDLDGSRMTADARVAAHSAGVGANMAFRRQTFERVGPFDTALDVGTPSNGGGDLDIFHRVLVTGLTIRYEPAAFVWHYHRREPEQLRKQLYNNGRAFGVYLLKILRTRTVPRSCALRYALFRWLGGWLVVRLLKTATKRERFPVRLVLAELWGATHALWAYGATYRADRKRRTLSALPSEFHV
jgi:glycosyltransferase involved in cell wall biosynthesis